MGTRIYIVIAALAAISIAGFAQTSAKDALRNIENYQNNAYADARKSGRTPDNDAIQQNVKKMALDVVKNLDPSAINVKDTYDYAKLYSVLGQYKTVCELSQKYLATEPRAADKFNAQLLIMNSCSALGDGKMLEQTLRNTKAGTPEESAQLAADCVYHSVFIDTIAKTEGAKDALQVLEMISRETVYPDPKEQAAKSLATYKITLGNQNANTPDFKMPSDNELLQTLEAKNISDTTFTKLFFAYQKARFLSEEGKTDEAVEVLDEFGKNLPANSPAMKYITIWRARIGLKGSVPPALDFDRKYGDFKSLADWKGRVVIIDTFAHWCGPCKASFPDVRKMYDDLHPTGLEIVGVTGYYGYYNQEKGLGPAAEYAKMAGFVKEHNMDWPVIFAPPDNKHGLDNADFLKYGISGIPTAILIGRDGKVIATEIGYTAETFKAWRQKIEAALANK